MWKFFLKAFVHVSLCKDAFLIPYIWSINFTLILRHMTFISLVIFSFPFSNLGLICVDQYYVALSHCTTHMTIQNTLSLLLLLRLWGGKWLSFLALRMSEENRTVYGDTTGIITVAYESTWFMPLGDALFFFPESNNNKN